MIFVVRCLSGMLGLLVVYTLCAGNVTADSADQHYPVHKLVRYSFTVRNATSQTMHGVSFWTYAPIQYSSTQKVNKLWASHPYQLIEDPSGNQRLLFSFPDLPPNGTRLVSIRAEMSFSDQSQPRAMLDDKPYLISERFVEADNPRIQALAKSLRAETPSATVRNIHSWVSTHLKWERYLAEEKGAAYAMEHLTGDCTESMDLFAALGRAEGIPVRGMGGYVHTENVELKSADFHNWAEYYLDGAWRIADPQKKFIEGKQSSYIQMQVLSRDPALNEMNFRFFTANPGLQVEMN